MSAAHRVKSADVGPKRLPWPVPSNLANRTPGVRRSRPGLTAMPHMARGTATGATRQTLSVVTGTGSGHVGRRTGGDADQLGVGDGEHGLRHSAGRPNLVVLRERRVNEGL